MEKLYLPVPIICSGMILTHLFFMLLVYRSNIHLYLNTLKIIGAGYLPVPNEHILPGLQQVRTAFHGALFFTLTLGIVFPSLIYSAAWAWDRGYRRNRAFLTLLSGFAIFCMVMINRHGANPIVSVWFLTVYVTVFKLTLCGLHQRRTPLSTKRLLTHLLVVAAIGVTWWSVPTGIDFFKAVRDHMLLSNSWGQQVTAFYYRYSPYPTESAKPLQKKQLKTIRIDGGPDHKTLERLETLLVRFDYLPIDTDTAPDVVLQVAENKLTFVTDGRAVLKTDTRRFLSTPAATLNRLSVRCDRQEFTRRFLAFSIAYGLPVFLYSGMFALFQCIFTRFFKQSVGFSLSATACLVIGAGAMIAFKILAPAQIASSQLTTALASKNPDHRVAALRTISAGELDLSDYVTGDLSKVSPYIPERIWWTKAMADSKHSTANDLLVGLLDDPHPLVVCMAYDALRKRGYRPAVAAILQRIKTSRHWYVQGYAYQTLRSLGWKQRASS